jgi:hypothetical protein
MQMFLAQERAAKFTKNALDPVNFVNFACPLCGGRCRRG